GFNRALQLYPLNPRNPGQLPKPFFQFDGIDTNPALNPAALAEKSGQVAQDVEERGNGRPFAKEDVADHGSVALRDAPEIPAIQRRCPTRAEDLYRLIAFAAIEMTLLAQHDNAGGIDRLAIHAKQLAAGGGGAGERIESAHEFFNECGSEYGIGIEK